MTLSSADIKRQILLSAKKSDVRGKIDSAIESGLLNDNDVLEQGEAFERMTTSKGWAFFEARMFRDLNPVVLITGDANEKAMAGARASVRIEDLHFIESMIQRRKEILEEDAKRKAAKNKE